MPSAIVTAIEQYKLALLRSEAITMRNMAIRWQGVIAGLEGDMQRLLADMAKREAKGEAISGWMLRRQERYQKLLQQASIEQVKYADYTQALTRATAQGAARRGKTDTQDLFRGLNMPPDVYDRIDVGAIERAAGILSDGSPVREVMMRRFPDQWQNIEQQIISGMARGLNPRDIVRRMQDILGGTLNNALRIVRTEQMRAYREATQASYQQSGVVSGYKRMASKDVRTCAACLAADGTEYRLGTPLIDHPNGRCALVPIVKGIDKPQWREGPQWFAALDPAEQRQILGPSKYEAWARNEFDFEQLAKIQNDPTWGKQIQVTPLKELV